LLVYGYELQFDGRRILSKLDSGRKMKLHLINAVFFMLLSEQFSKFAKQSWAITCSECVKSSAR